MAEADPALAGGSTRAGNDKDYHVVRARAELDAAYRAESSAVAAVHLKLAAIHMRRAQLFSEVRREAEMVWIERCAPLHQTHLAEIGERG